MFLSLYLKSSKMSLNLLRYTAVMVFFQKWPKPAQLYIHSIGITMNSMDEWFLTSIESPYLGIFSLNKEYALSAHCLGIPSQTIMPITMYTCSRYKLHRWLKWTIHRFIKATYYLSVLEFRKLKDKNLCFWYLTFNLARSKLNTQ